MRFLKAFFLVLTASVMRSQVSVIPTITHLASTSTPSAGAITLSVSAGTAPHTYSWTPGSYTTQAISGRPYGSYTVKVTDSGTNTVTYNYNIGYKINWSEFYGTVQKQDTIKNDGSYGWAMAVSKNTLSAGADGWVEYVLKDLSQFKKIGFLDSLSTTKSNAADIDFGFYYGGTTNALQKITYGVESAMLSNPPEGSVLRVERVGNVIRLKVNGVVTYSTTSAPHAAKMWKVKVHILSANSSMINVGCSFYNQGNIIFPGYGGLKTIVTHVNNPFFNEGSAKVTPVPNGAYTYTWQPGSIPSSSITSLPAGTYSLTIEDSLHNKRRDVYNIGYKVKWEQFHGTAAKHDTLINLGSIGWAQAISKNILPGSTDGWFEYVLRDMNQTRKIGFLDSVYNAKGNELDVDYGFFYEAATKRLHKIIKGVVSAIENPSEGSVLRIERIGSTINLKINGIVAYSTTNAVDVSKNWKIKALVLIPSSTVIDLGMSTSACSLTASAGTSQTITCANPTITLTGSSNTSGVTYSWSPGGATTSSISVTTKGTYTLTVTDPSSGCIATATTVVLSNTISPTSALSVVSNSGLIGYWPFTGTANDASLNGNDGTVYGADLAIDRFGNPNRAYWFNGTSDYIQVPHSTSVDMTNGTDFTISFWMKAESTDANVPPIAKHKSDGSWNGYMFIRNNTDGGYCNGDGTFTFYAASGASADACANTLVSNDLTNWVFVTSQYKSSTNEVKLYINSVLQSDIGTVSGTLSNTMNLFFGAHDPLNSFYKGALDDIRIYKRLLSESEIKGLYFEPDPLATSLTCVKSNATLTGFSPVSGVTYSWTPGGATTPTLQVSSAGTYTVKVTDPSNGCFGTRTFTVSSNTTPPSASTSGNQTITCTSPSVTLTGTTNAVHPSYLWTPSGSSPGSYQTTVNIPDTYTLTVTNTLNGCSSQAFAVVTFSNNMVTPAISYTGSPFAAIVSSPQPVTLTGATGGVFSYDPDGLDIDPTTGAIIPSSSMPGSYTIIYTSVGALKTCAYRVTTNVLVGVACEFSILPSTEIQICEGEIVTLFTSNHDVDYLWAPSTGLSCTNCDNPYFSASPSVTQYTVYAYPDGYGSLACGVRTVSISIIPDCNTVIGCCFSNYGAVVCVADPNTHINVYCNLVNELGQFANGSIKKGEFVNYGKINVKLDWIHNGQNTLYLVPIGESNFFGGNQNIRGNSSTHFNRIDLTGNGIKTTWIDEYATRHLNLNSNELFIRNHLFAVKNPTVSVTNTGGGFVSTLTNGYLSRAVNTTSVYIYPMGSRANGTTPFRYRPVEISQSATADELSVNFMNEAPAITDAAFVSVGSLSDKAPNVSSLNNQYYHKIKKTDPNVISTSTLTIKSYFPPADGTYQSLAEWEKDPAQINYWWGSTPGAMGTTIPGTNGMIYASTSGRHTFNGKPFTLARSGAYVGTGDFGGTPGTGGNGTTITITTPGTPGGGTGGGLGTPSSVGSSGPGSTIVTPPVVAVDYVISVTPANDCALPGQIKFTVNPDGSIPKTSVLYGLQGSSTYLGPLSEDVYEIDNQNTGLILHSTPKSILKNCINSVKVTTSIGSDYVLNYTLNPAETINAYIPSTPLSLILSPFVLYDISNAVVYTSPASLVQGNNALSPALVAGTYHFTFSINSELVTGQIIVQ
jgi:hypothetical protein